MILYANCPGVGWGPPCIVPTSGVGGVWGIYSKTGEYAAPEIGNAFEIWMVGTYSECGQLLTQMIAQAQQLGMIWFYADNVGPTLVTPGMSPQIGTNCTGDIVAQFSL
jgi:hypothetical protein